MSKIVDILIFFARKVNMSNSIKFKAHEKNMTVAAHDERTKFSVMLFVTGYLAVWALIMNPVQVIIEGLYKILVSPAGLLTDYFMLASPGAALMNASIMTFLSLLLVKKTKVPITGVIMAAVLTVTGFSLFGKNPFNALPIVVGVLLHARLKKEPFAIFLAPALFGTALGPVVSEIAFNIGLPLPLGLFLGILSGLSMGLLIPIIAVPAMGFHKGYSLYNIGFTAGIVGTFIVSIARGFGAKIVYESQIASGYNKEMAVMLFLLLFILMLLGLKYNRWNLRGYEKFLKLPGIAGTDIIGINGIGLTIFNMALVGFVSTIYILIVGGELNGPTIGGVLTVLAFGAFGKHPRNIIPVIFGIWLMATLGNFDVNSTGVLIAACFGTTLAPVAGKYGWIAGVLAGMIHLNFVVNTGSLYAGLNLYNNGFAGGLVAGIMIPLFEYISLVKQKLADNHASPRKKRDAV